MKAANLGCVLFIPFHKKNKASKADPGQPSLYPILHVEALIFFFLSSIILLYRSHALVS